ncbi:MAG: hypothetical protein ACOCQD_03645 [archaeon]
MINKFDIGETVYVQDDQYEKKPFTVVGIQTYGVEHILYGLVASDDEYREELETNLSRNKSTNNSLFGVVEIFDYNKIKWEEIIITESNQHVLNGYVIDSFKIYPDGSIRLRLDNKKLLSIKNKKDFYDREDF